MLGVGGSSAHASLVPELGLQHDAAALRRTYLRFMDQAIPLLAQDSQDHVSKLEGLREEAPAVTHDMSRAVERELNTLAALRCARALLDLAAGEEGPLPADPFVPSRPLRSRRDGGVAVIWSVGPNREDEGGIHAEDGWIDDVGMWVRSPSRVLPREE